MASCEKSTSSYMQGSMESQGKEIGISIHGAHICVTAGVYSLEEKLFL